MNRLWPKIRQFKLLKTFKALCKTLVLWKTGRKKVVVLREPKEVKFKVSRDRVNGAENLDECALVSKTDKQNF